MIGQGTDVQMACIDVSPEMISFVGSGSIGHEVWPEDSVGFLIEFGEGKQPDKVQFFDSPQANDFCADGSGRKLVFLVARTACHRILGKGLDLDDRQICYLPTMLASIAIAIRDSRLAEAARKPYRLAKSIELLCELLALIAQRKLIAITGNRHVSETDRQRLLLARQLIDASWSEKLTLDDIGRACGLNRNKLTSGFREMFDCSVVDAITEQRLRAARGMLLSTELPVSSIGYKCGYMNNASFARAFSRHFGVAPTQFRAMEGVVA